MKPDTCVYFTHILAPGFAGDDKNRSEDIAMQPERAVPTFNNLNVVALRCFVQL